MKFRAWLGSLLSVFFSGLAGGLSVMLIPPYSNLPMNWKGVFMVAGVSALVGVINFLAKSPLPEV